MWNLKNSSRFLLDESKGNKVRIETEILYRVRACLACALTSIEGRCLFYYHCIMHGTRIKEYHKSYANICTNIPLPCSTLMHIGNAFTVVEWQ